MYNLNTYIAYGQKSTFTLPLKFVKKAHRVSLTRYVFDEHYVNKCKRQIYAVPQDGVVDSIRSLLYNYNQHSKHLVKLLHSPFQ